MIQAIKDYSFSGIYGVLLRYVFVYTRSGLRLFELFFWPIIQLLVWGFLTRYLMQMENGDYMRPVQFILGGVLLWDVQFRATQGVSISLLEDIWTRNLLNIFVAPLRTWEFVMGTCLVGLFRVVLTLPLLILMAYLWFDFNLFQMSLWLLPFYGNLLLFGWCLGIMANCLIIRWGQAAEGLCWAMPFVIQPFAAVYYSVSALPEWLQVVSMTLPCSHVFEGMREVLVGDYSQVVDRMMWALFLNVIWMIIAGFLMHSVLNIARQRGLLVRVGTQ